MRKIRNSARFILGNIGTVAQRKDFVPVQHNELGLVSPRLYLIFTNLIVATGGTLRDERAVQARSNRRRWVCKLQFPER
jgi:hypothetical protein